MHFGDTQCCFEESVYFFIDGDVEFARRVIVQGPCGGEASHATSYYCYLLSFRHCLKFMCWYSKDKLYEYLQILSSMRGLFMIFILS